MLYEEKQKVLTSISSENELRTELIVPLLKKMAEFSDVLDNQGSDEAGVDVIGISTSPFKKPEYTAFVLKLGDITLKVSDQKNNLVNIIETQIREAIRHPLTHPRLPSDKCFANRIIVLVNGNVSKNAEQALRRSFTERSDISLDFVGQDRLIEKIDALWPGFYEDRRPFLSSYAKKLFDSLNVIDFEELGYAKRKHTLTDIYIDALLFEQDNIATDGLSIDKIPIAGEQLCKQRHQLMIITCGPGGGKSTLLKEIAISESQNQKEQVAVYLHARDVLETKDITRKAAESLSQLSNDSVSDVYEEIKDSKLLLLVDGLDEIAALSDREAVIDILRSANKQLDARIIIGSRPESNPRILASLSEFKAYSISPLRKSQIRNFFGKWFKNNIDKASKLVGALEDKGIFDKLPKTPMTMTLVAIVYESKEDIPSTLTELYAMFIDLLTGKWDANRKITSPFDSQVKLSFLAHLAWVMQTERLDTVSQDRCLALAKDFFENRATVSNVDVIGFIQSIIDRSHILIPSGHDQLRFSHMTFQEYFAAEQLIRESPSNETILSWFGDDWWKEVLFFLAGKRKDISNVVDALLAADYSDPETRMTKLVTLGSMLQSGFLTEGKYKYEAVSFAAKNFLFCLDDMKTALSSITSQKIKKRISRVMLLGFLEQLFSANYCSIYLKKALEETYKNLPKNAENEGARFFAACALSKMKDYEPILEFATEPSMIDTSMYLLSTCNLSERELDPAEEEKFRKIKKRIKYFQEAIEKELNKTRSKPLRRLSAKRKK